jgi:hypothetical protein
VGRAGCFGTGRVGVQVRTVGGVAAPSTVAIAVTVHAVADLRWWRSSWSTCADSPPLPAPLQGRGCAAVSKATLSEAWIMPRHLSELVR